MRQGYTRADDGCVLEQWCFICTKIQQINTIGILLLTVLQRSCTCSSLRWMEAAVCQVPVGSACRKSQTQGHLGTWPRRHLGPHGWPTTALARRAAPPPRAALCIGPSPSPLDADLRRGWPGGAATGGRRARLDLAAPVV